jgi:helix-turn-helix protein
VSVQAMTSVFSRSRCGGTTRLVLLAIANYYGDNGAWPSIDSLARDCQMSRRAIQDCLRRAEGAGELHVEKNAGHGGTNRYWLHIEEGGCRFCTRADSRRESAPEPKELGVRGRGVSSRSSHPTSLAPTARDELFEAVAEACGIDWHNLTKAARGSLNAALAQLRAVRATPGEVHSRAEHYRERYDAELTPSALAKHWPALVNGKAKPPSPYDRVDYEAFLGGGP